MRWLGAGDGTNAPEHRLSRLDGPGLPRRRAVCVCGAFAMVRPEEGQTAWTEAALWMAGHRHWPDLPAGAVATLLYMEGKNDPAFEDAVTSFLLFAEDDRNRRWPRE